jgi:glycosyltransferase involved in cell wall biosynthesis
MPRADVLEWMKAASCLLLPSICYEGLPMTLIEAFACGLPVVGSRIGSLECSIRDGFSGLLFEPGSETDLMSRVHALLQNDDLRTRLRIGARSEYELKYSGDASYSQLMKVYEAALQLRNAPLLQQVNGQSKLLDI